MTRSCTPLLFGAFVLLTACAGGGSSGSSGGSTTTGGGAPPTPPPSTSPSPFNTTEFQANWALDAVNALAAYDDGLSGLGIIIAVMDTGIDLQQTDLDDNMHAASKDIYDGSSNVVTARNGSNFVFQQTRTGGVSLDDIDGHGTFVSGVAAAEKNDLLSHGLAFNAEILAMRVDEHDSCATDCAFDDNALAAALQYAVNNGADIVNFSLGGSPANSYLEGELEDAVQAGLVIVFSAGNADESSAPYFPSANPDPFAMAAVQSWANGQILIAGASDSAGNIADFSNRAGTGKDFYLLAPGVDLYAPTVNSGTGATTHGIGSGTSFAAPVVAAGAALLMEKFPALTAEEIVQILLTTATDVGAPGVDDINGHGIMNLEAAIAPLGTTSLVIKTTSGALLVDTQEGGLLVGGAFGDGVGRGLMQGSIFLDIYDRAYETSLAERMTLENAGPNFDGRLAANRLFEKGTLALTPGLSVSFEASYEEPLSIYETSLLGLERADLRQDTDDQMRGGRLSFVNQLDDRTEMRLGFGGSLSELWGLADPSGARGQAFLSDGARLSWGQSGDGGRQMMIARSLGSGFTVSGGYGVEEVDLALDTQVPLRTRDVSRTAVLAGLGYGAERYQIDLTLGQIREDGSVLGSQSAGYFNLGNQADTSFASLSADRALGQIGSARVSVFGRTAFGLTEVSGLGVGVFSDIGEIATSQFALGLALDTVFDRTDRLTLLLSQPLRVERGLAHLATASAWDYESETAVFDLRSSPLTPSGRELDLELGYGFSALGMRYGANLQYQYQPGHVSGQDGALNVMLTGRSRF